MIIVMKQGSDKQAIHQVETLILNAGLNVHLSEGREVTIVGVVGDKSQVNREQLTALPQVEKIVDITESYKLANRKFHPEPTVVHVRNTTIGGDRLTIMAGPCAIESEEMMLKTAYAVKAAGANFLRGGAFKPRTSPYSFQGLEETGLKYMKAAADATGLASVCEVTSLSAIEKAVKYVDMLQIGARNMQNFALLKEAGKTGLPILLKRGLSATIDEWLNAAEYIMAGGNPNVILCERGIRTFENYTRNTLDISAVAAVKKLSHLPILVDPSHATGRWWMVEPMALAAVAAGADGVMIEVHNDPVHALSDGKQSVTPEVFDELMKKLRTVAGAVGRTV